MKIFIGLTEIAGFYRGLKEGFDELGVEATFAPLKRHRFDYGGYTDNILVRWARYAHEKHVSSPPWRAVKRLFWERFSYLSRWWLFLWALAHHDAFIFGFNTSFFSFRELWLLKLFGKKIVYQFHGSDSRPPYMNGFIARNASMPALADMTRRTKKIIGAIEKYADVIVNIPPQAYFHERPFVMTLLVGIPCRPRAIEQPGVASVGDNSEIRILHSPSNPEAKGSAYIEQIIKEMKVKGHKARLIMLTNTPNREVMNELRQCDFVIDQVYSDYHMPGFATEAAWFGKPAIIGGYAAKAWKEWLPKEMIPPTLYCHPDDMASAVEKLIEDKSYRLELGARAKEFVMRYWSPQQVSRQYLRLITGDIPKEWLFNPECIQYFHGAGMPESMVKKRIGRLLEYGGERSLELSDKPELAKAFTLFANSNQNLCAQEDSSQRR